MPFSVVGAAALDTSCIRNKPFKWLADNAWFNLIQLSASSQMFKNLVEVRDLPYAQQNHYLHYPPPPPKKKALVSNIFKRQVWTLSLAINLFIITNNKVPPLLSPRNLQVMNRYGRAGTLTMSPKG